MSDVRHLWALAAEIAAVIEAWLKEHEDKIFYIKFKKTDLLRLTRLQVWSWRHKVGIEEILSLTLPYLRKSLVTTQRSGHGIGCSVAALTGAGNEKILIQALIQKYPGGEHQDIWRDAERKRQLDVEAQDESEGLQVREKQVRGIFDCDSVLVYIKSYRARVEGARSKMALELNDPKRRRKAYRGNPWI